MLLSSLHPEFNQAHLLIKAQCYLQMLLYVIVSMIPHLSLFGFKAVFFSSLLILLSLFLPFKVPCALGLRFLSSISTFITCWSCFCFLHFTALVKNPERLFDTERSGMALDVSQNRNLVKQEMQRESL